MPGGDRVNDYRPVPGDRVHVTIAMVVDETGRFLAENMHGDPWLWLPLDPCIVRVERALPVDEYALIVAEVCEQGTCLLELRDQAPPFGAPGEEIVPDLRWVISGTSHVVESHRIEPGWRSLDRRTLRTVDR